MHDAVDGFRQDAVGVDDGLDAAGQEIERPVPIAQLALADLVRDRLGRMPDQGLREGNVQVVAVGVPAVVGPQLLEHLPVVVGVQDAFEDDVVAGVEAVAGNDVDEADVRAAGAVAFTQDNPAEVVLADQGQAATEALPYLPPYAPDLNPVEGIWSLLRRGWLSNVAFATPEHLVQRIRRGLRHIQYRSDLINGCLAETGLNIRAT